MADVFKQICSQKEDLMHPLLSILFSHFSSAQLSHSGVFESVCEGREN